MSHIFKIAIPAAGHVFVVAKNATAAKQAALAGVTAVRLTGTEARALPADTVVLGENPGPVPKPFGADFVANTEASTAE